TGKSVADPNKTGKSSRNVVRFHPVLPEKFEANKFLELMV
ncbi:MAG: hypothetical protein CI952_1242, partial [Methanohalophilus sp.]